MAEVTIPRDALVLVGDGEKVLFLRNQGTPQDPKLVTEEVMQQRNPATREQGSDKPGRYAGPHGYGGGPGAAPRSAFAQTDWHQIGEERFAGEIADALYRLAHANRFQDLIVVAPPKALGSLRKAFHKEVAERIRGEIPKELTQHDLPGIQRLLAS